MSDEEFEEKAPHREKQCRGMVFQEYSVQSPKGTTEIRSRLVRCSYRGELTKVHKKLLCPECRAEAIEKSVSEKERNKR